VYSDGDTYLLDARTGRTLRRIKDGGEPLAVDERAGRALISGLGRPWLIATGNGAPLRTGLDALDALTVEAVAVDEIAGRFYVATDDALWVLDERSGRLERVLSLRATPVTLAVDAATHRVFLLTAGSPVAPSADPTPPLLRWVQHALPWLPLPTMQPTGASGTLTVLDTTHL
jgi:hypothetical protein